MSKTLHIFDFDDTLVTSDAEVVVYHGDDTISKLDSGKFASYIPLEDDRFDFSDFEIYPPGGRTIPSTFRKLQKTLRELGSENVVILTARGAAAPVRKFLSDNGIRQKVSVVALGSPNPNDKGKFVANKLMTGDFNHVHVYEDNINNVNAIRAAAEDAGVGFSHTLIIPEIIQKNDVTDLSGFIRETIIENSGQEKSAGIIILREFPEGLRVLGLRIFGRYDLPKGHVELGENILDAALRETAEEAGITDIQFPWGLSTVHAKHVTLFIGMTNQDPVIRPNPETGKYEHHGAAWLTWEKLEEKITSYLYPVIASAKNIVNGRTKS